MRYFVKINKAGYPVPNSLVYSNAMPKMGRWYEIKKPCLNCEGDCIQMNKPQGYFQEVKYYYTTDEFCHPIAGSNVSAYCKPSPGRFMEYFPTCLIKPCELEIKNYNITYKGPSTGCTILYTTPSGVTATEVVLAGQTITICAQIHSIKTTCALEDFEIIESWDNCIEPITTTSTTTTTSTSTTSTSTSTSTTSSTTTSSTSSTTSSTTSTTSTSTTTTQDQVLCAPLYNSNVDLAVYSYNFATNTSTPLTVPGYVGSAQIAHTVNKLWAKLYAFTPPYINNTLTEWNISSISPFVSTFNRNINLPPTQFYFSDGLNALTDTKLVAVNEYYNPMHVVELDISGATAIENYQFSFVHPQRFISGDFIVTTGPTPKFIATTNDFNYTAAYLSQYDYTTGALELDIDITAAVGKTAYGVFQNNGEIYIGTGGTPGVGNIYHIDKTYPYAITLFANTGIDISDASQIPSCLTGYFELPPTTISTTSTTTSSTSTTSTSTSTTAGPPPPGGLKLTWNNIANVPVADPSVISQWNAFFDLPNYGIPFSSVIVSGNDVYLYGGGGILLTTYIFGGNININGIEDNSGCISTLGAFAFDSCIYLFNVNFPAVTYVGYAAFSQNQYLQSASFASAIYIDGASFESCINLNNVYIPSCTNLGGDVYDNQVFVNITGINPFNLTIPTALMTCSDSPSLGSPDGDIQYLQANNNVVLTLIP